MNMRTDDGVVHSVIREMPFENERVDFDVAVCGLWCVFDIETAGLGEHERFAVKTTDEVTCLLCIGA